MRTSAMGYKGDEVFEDFVQVGNTSFKFPAIDNGIYILSSITTAQNMLSVFEDNATCTVSEFEIIKRNAALKVIRNSVLEYS